MTWLDAIDWTGIDLGLYGNWEALPARHPLRRYVAGKQITTTRPRRSIGVQIGLNLYRETPPARPPAESLNPRAYELAACGVCALSEVRAEGQELFGSWSPAPTEAVLRDWLGDAERRAAVQRQVPLIVAHASWAERVKTVLGDLQFFQRAA